MNTEIEEKKKYLLHWMYDFIEDDDEPAYQKKDVDECDQILTAFINAVDGSEHKSEFAWISSQVERLVKTLNILNEKHQHQLLETHQREDLCALISLVIAHAGHDYEEDLTEQWREW
ncbi:hypothetical protein [Neptunomonas qingdaonensis]|uniref:Uncharacterized protein n=1 Tax=Neptunomonas qingdaonensis TaxID=1045558 RepID=A0A1I2QUY3_9GAMM|nr:hypothetical protein [Neptunomonas qingdaonensis]SFG29431.1 hypothetical protein SAMN05216175_10535 [Neptunomonas qingdaonensis]